MKLDDVVLMGGSLATALSHVEIIEEDLADQPFRERNASRLMVALVILCELAETVAEEVGRDPREVVASITKQADERFRLLARGKPKPEEQPPERPERKSSRKGPSPWRL